MPVRDFHSTLDLEVFRAINRGGGRLLDLSMQVLSMRAFGIAFGLLLCALLIAALRRGAARPVVALAIAIFTSDLVGSQLVRPVFGRMRPCYALPPGTFRWLAPAADVSSLPSLHASNMFALALVVSLARPRLAPAAYLAAAAVAISRVYVGVHWPSDVLAGMAWGTLSGAVAWGVAATLPRRPATAAPGGGRGDPPR